jgi:hypothetical protein
MQNNYRVLNCLPLPFRQYCILLHLIHFRLYDEDHIFKFLEMKEEVWDKYSECSTAVISESMEV